MVAYIHQLNLKVMSIRLTPNSPNKFTHTITCYHCGNGMTTARCPTCTYGVDFTCANCNEEWMGNDDDSPVGAHGFRN
jgi:rRNA maturation endonuclease Nob1